MNARYYSPLLRFNEAAFPAVQDAIETHAERIRRGRSRMVGSRAIICGLARDLGSGIHNVIFWIERLGASFLDYRVIIVENSSRDRTREHLEYWTRRNNRVHLLGGDAGSRRFGPTRERERTEMLAQLRESYRAFVAAEFSQMDFAIVLDTDLEAGWSARGIADTFGQAEWDGVASNGLIHVRAIIKGEETNAWRQVYYDSWAFRAVGHADAHLNTPINRMHLERGRAMIPVFSAFGGLAVYRMQAFLSSRYVGDDCEHVSFHAGMRHRGFGRLFVNPSQIVLYNLSPQGALVLAPPFSPPSATELAAV